jgi:hypothetical protein
MENTFFGLVVGVMLSIVFVFTTQQVRPLVPESVFAACAAGYDPDLRFTSGTATFKVEFNDGELYSFECLPNP